MKVCKSRLDFDRAESLTFYILLLCILWSLEFRLVHEFPPFLFKAGSKFPAPTIGAIETSSKLQSYRHWSLACACGLRMAYLV